MVRAFSLACSLVVGGLLIAPSSASAQTLVFWTNSGSGNWATGSNWNAGVPTSSSVAIVNNGTGPASGVGANSGGTAVLSSGTVSVNELRIGWWDSANNGSTSSGNL